MIGEQSKYHRKLLVSRNGRLRRLRRYARGDYPIGLFIKYYLLAWIAVLGSLVIAPPLFFLAYPLTGYALNRAILPYVRWQKYKVTLDDVAR